MDCYGAELGTAARSARAQQHHSGSIEEGTVPPFGHSFAQIGDVLESQIQRGLLIAHRIEALGAATFGAIPQQVSAARDAPDSPPPSLTRYADQIGEVMDRIERALDRF